MKEGVCVLHSGDFLHSGALLHPDDVGVLEVAWDGMGDIKDGITGFTHGSVILLDYLIGAFAAHTTERNYSVTLSLSQHDEIDSRVGRY